MIKTQDSGGKGKRESRRAGRLAFLLFCFLAFASVLCVASEDYPSLKWLGLPVVSVEYTCDGEFSEAEVRSATFVQVGSVYFRSDIRKSIEKIYSLGGFSKVEVSARPADNGVILTFALTKQIKAGSVYLTGNKELGEEEIIQVMRLKHGQEYDDSIAEMDVQSIKELYRSRGYFDADVSFKPIIDDNSKQADIYFEITENKQPLVGEIVFIGTNQAVIRTKMLFHIGLEFQSDLDSKNISAGLLQEFQSKGNSLSDKAAVSIERAGSRWLVTDVQKAYSIRKEEDRLNVYKTRTLLEVMREVRLGEPYKGKQALDSDKKLIEQIHRQRDYITAKIKKAQDLSDPNIIKEYHEKGTHFLIHLPPAARHPSPVSIIIEIEQGRRIYIKIEGDKDIKDDIIKRSIAVQRMHSVSEPVLRKSDEDIENLYKLKGYYLAKVEHEVLEDKVWIFGTDGDTEEQGSGGPRERGWRPFGEFTSMDVSGNSLRVSSSDNIPQIQSPKVEIDTDIYQKIHIRMRINKGSVGRLYWTDKPDKWDREKHQDFDLVSDNQFRNHEIDLRNHKKWHGKVIQLRLRPVDLPGADIDIASIKVTTEFIPIVFRVDKKRLMRVKEVSIMAPSLFSIDSKFQTYLDRSSRGMGDFPHENISTELRREFESKGTSLSQDATVSIEKEGRKWLIAENSRDTYIVRKEEGKLEIHPKLELDEENIRKQMLTRKRNPLSFWPLSRYLPDGIFYEPIFEMDRRAIIAFYKDKGYPNAEVVDYKIDPKEENGEIDLSITIDEGSKVFVTGVILEGNYKDILDNEEILKNLAVVPSFQEQNLTIESSDPPRVRYKISSPKVFREDDIVADRSYLRSRYADEGYLAQIQPIKQFNDDHTQVTIIYRITDAEGNRIVAGKKIKIDDKIEIRTYRIVKGKQVRIDDANARTKRYVIERELSDKLTEEKIFSYTEIAKSWQRLIDLGLFGSVRIDTEPVIGSEDLYKIVIEVVERDAISVNMHAGFSSLADFRGGIQATHVNLFGTGRRLGAKAQIGTEGARGELNYTEPRLLGTRALGLVDVYRQPEKYKDVDENEYAETRTGGTAGISQTLNRVNMLTYRYRYDFVQYRDPIDGNEKETKIGSIETTFERDGRDNPLNPTKGWFHSLTLQYANSRLGGEETFAKFTTNNAHYARISRNLVLALGGRTGYAWGLGGTKLVLIPEQFQLSDYPTPRGYKWGIEDTGSVMLDLSMEIRFPIYKRIGAAAFFDSGCVCAKLSDFDIRSMRSSVGLGLRFITPIGPLRLDYGYPVRGNGDRNYWPHVAFGHAF